MKLNIYKQNYQIIIEYDGSKFVGWQLQKNGKSIQTLKSAVNAMNKNSSINITIAGHADERGTREYNLALGQRRAESVKDYFVLNGISSNRITVKSYGEEKPAVKGQDERSYARNRRVEIN